MTSVEELHTVPAVLRRRSGVVRVLQNGRSSAVCAGNLVNQSQDLLEVTAQRLCEQMGYR